MTQDTSDTLFPSQDNSTTPLSDENTSSGQTGAQNDTELLKQEIVQLREQLARSQADYANLVRRNREESLQIGEWSENKTILRFLSILDNLERALEHTPPELKSHAWIEGINSIVRSMQKILTDMGVTRMTTRKQEIDPDLHDVVSQIPASNSTIQTEVEAGYLRGGKALRHAKVIVGDGSLS